jgi:hypothetical protein
VERDDAGLMRAVDRRPRDALVRVLLGDLRVELADLSRDLDGPVEAHVVDLTDLLDALHEVREVLELRPLVVRRADWDLHLDALLDRRHAFTS